MAEYLLPEIQSLMQVYHFRPDKRMGQNFITDQGIIDRLVADAHLSSHDTAIEIGGGTGFITRAILPHIKKLICFEPDETLFELLQKEHASSKLDLRKESAFLDAWPAFDKIVSAPPYHYSSQLMERIFFHETMKGGALLLQQEFVTKLSAFAGLRDYTAISVISQVRFTLTVGKTVPRGAFYPVPQSDSAILSLSHPFPYGKPASLTDFYFIVSELFRYKNKNVAKSLSLCEKSFEKHFGKKSVTWLKKVPLELMEQKVFQLEPTDFLAIAKAFE